MLELSNIQLQRGVLMFVKALIFLFLSYTTSVYSINSLERIGTFDGQNQNKQRLATCQDKSGRVFQIRLSTVEYIILLQKQNIKTCSFSFKI